MCDTNDKFSRDVRIVNELGLHARSAARIAEIAMKAESDVWIIREGYDEAVDARSIIDMLTLACAKGTAITVKIVSPSDAAVLDDIVKLVECGFGE